VQHQLVGSSPGELVQYQLVGSSPGELVQYQLFGSSPEDLSAELAQHQLVRRLSQRAGIIPALQEALPTSWYSTSSSGALLAS
jgi:hypothetical protein